MGNTESWIEGVEAREQRLILRGLLTEEDRMFPLFTWSNHDMLLAIMSLEVGKRPAVAVFG
jgi:hypothetical protein